MAEEPDISDLAKAQAPFLERIACALEKSCEQQAEILKMARSQTDMQAESLRMHKEASDPVAILKRICPPQILKDMGIQVSDPVANPPVINLPDSPAEPTPLSEDRVPRGRRRHVRNTPPPPEKTT